MPRKTPLAKTADFILGHVEQNGPHVQVTLTAGQMFKIERAATHPCGWECRYRKALRHARVTSSALRNEKPRP